MIDLINYDAAEGPSGKLLSILSRAIEFTPELETSVGQIVADVRQQGDAAVLAYTAQFDGVTLDPDDLRVPQAEIDAAHREADGALIEVIEAAAANIRRFHEAQKRTSWYSVSQG